MTREHQLKQIESENKLFEEQNKTQEISREKLEKDLRLVSSKKEDLENQFTALTLEKVFFYSLHVIFRDNTFLNMIFFPQIFFQKLGGPS